MSPLGAIYAALGPPTWIIKFQGGPSARVRDDGYTADQAISIARKVKDVSHGKGVVRVIEPRTR